MHLGFCDLTIENLGICDEEIRRDTINRLRTLVRETKPNRQRKTHVLTSVGTKHKESKKIVTHILSPSDNAKFER